MIPQHLSITQEHPSPGHVVEAARRAMGGFDIDPASTEMWNRTSIMATRFIGLPDDGLALGWKGPRVWLNPPGGRCPPRWRKVFETASNATAWWRKLMEEKRYGRVDEFVFLGFTLEILRTSQGSDLFESAMTYPFCVPRERLCFAGDDPTHANVIIYGGPNFDAFKREFSEIGEVKP